MRTLDRKLLRDARREVTLLAAIAAVIAAGVATFVMSLSTIDSLRATTDAFYERMRFADVFAPLDRAPQAVAARLAEIPGVTAVETRVVTDVVLDVPGLLEPASARLVSLPRGRPPALNLLHLRRGRWLEPGRREILVGEAFAEAHGLGPGDDLFAVIDGKRERLAIVGVVLSPEYVFQIRPGELLPDDRRFGVFWMDEEELAAALDLDGAFNDVTLGLAPDATEAAVIAEVDRRLAVWGGLGAHGREDQVSHEFVTNELKQLRGMAVITPTIFLVVAAFLLNIVLSRLVQTQRSEIAMLEAFGYPRRAIGIHYLKLVMLVVAGGVAVGTLGGGWLGRGLTRIYSRFFRFPEFDYTLAADDVVLALAVASAAAVLGALGAVRRAVTLPPAEAMRPEPPASFRPTVAERLGFQRLLSPGARMVLRDLERRPVRALLSAFALALGVATLVVGTFTLDAIEEVIEQQFVRSQRWDVSLTFAEPLSADARHAAMTLPGVLHAEPVRSVPVRLRHGHRERRLAITGLAPDRRLFRLLEAEDREIVLPPDGLVLSAFLADVLGVTAGERVTVEVLEGERPVRELRVAGFVEDFAGAAGWMDLGALARFVRETSLSGVHLAVDSRRLPAFYEELRETPAVAGVNVKHAVVDGFRRMIAENLLVMRTFMIAFASIIAFGVVYNAARISLAERARELGTLRVIGFTRQEVSGVLLGELAALLAAAIPLGLVLGYGLAGIAVVALQTETQRFPLIVTPFTYGFASATVLVAAVVSALVVRRRIDRLDLVAVLKAME